MARRRKRREQRHDRNRIQTSSARERRRLKQCDAQHAHARATVAAVFVLGSFGTLIYNLGVLQFGKYEEYSMRRGPAASVMSPLKPTAAQFMMQT